MGQVLNNLGTNESETERLTWQIQKCKPFWKANQFGGYCGPRSPGEYSLWIMNTEILPANWFNSDGSSLTKYHRSRCEIISLIYRCVNAVSPTEPALDFQ